MTVMIGLLLFSGCQRAQVLAPVETRSSLMEAATQSVVFIAGYDEGSNTYYTNAKRYFQNQNIKLVDSLYSVQEILSWLAHNGTTGSYDKIHIVSHSNAWRGMSLKTDKEGERVTVETLKKAQRSGTFLMSNPAITAATQIIFHSCGLGDNALLMEQLKQTFAGKQSPQIIASPYFNIFQGKYTAHYLAKPYYGYYPTAQSEGPLALSKTFASTYPDTSIDWLKAVKKRSEGQVGEVYSYKFNIPISWTYTFEDPAQIPQLETKDAIMDWIVEDPELATVLLQMAIPIEDYRWTSSIVDNELHIYGKTTVVCVMQPIMDAKDPTEYEIPCIDNEILYKKI